MSSTISSISSGSWVSSLFSKIDTKNQGYIDKTELSTALENLSSSDTATADKIFSKLDADQDGKITKQEMSDGMQKLADELDSQFNASRVKSGSATESADDAGFSKEELASQVEELGDTDSKRTTLMTNIINNFDKADTDGNGKVTRLEAMAYDEANPTSSTTSTSGTSSASAAGAPPPSGGAGGSSSTTYDAADANEDGTVSLEELIAYKSASDTTTSADTASVVKTMMQLFQSYGMVGQESSTSSSISAIA